MRNAYVIAGIERLFKSQTLMPGKQFPVDAGEKNGLDFTEEMGPLNIKLGPVLSKGAQIQK